MKIFSIKNEKLGFYNRPMFCESSSEALSYIQNILMSDSDRALSGLKGDLSLYHLGDIDFETGDIIPGNFFVTSLEEIFDSIPKDRLKIAPSTDDFKKLEKYVKELDEKFNNHTHNRKEIHK